MCIFRILDADTEAVELLDHLLFKQRQLCLRGLDGGARSD
jgi:hypothetical protein